MGKITIVLEEATLPDGRIGCGMHVDFHGEPVPAGGPVSKVHKLFEAMMDGAHQNHGIAGGHAVNPDGTRREIPAEPGILRDEKSGTLAQLDRSMSDLWGDYGDKS